MRHEFDELYGGLVSKGGYYLFGAGDYGKQFAKLIKDEISIYGYVDNDVKNMKRF